MRWVLPIFASAVFAYMGPVYAEGSSVQDASCDAKTPSVMSYEQKSVDYTNRPWREARTQATVHFMAGRHAEAEKSLLEAIKIAKETNDTEPLPNLLQMLGVVYSKSHQYELAVQTLQQSVEMQRTEKKDRPIFLLTLSQLGEAYNKLQQYDKALSILLEAKAQMTPCMHGYYNLVHSLGTTYKGLAKYPEAEATILEAVKLSEKYHDLVQVSDNQCLLIELYIAQKDYKKALKAAEDAEPLIAQLHKPDSREYIIFNKNTQHLRDAVNAEGATAVVRPNNPEWLALAQNAKKDIDAKQYTAGISKYERALKMAEAEDPASIQTAHNRIWLATVYMTTGKNKEAEQLYAKALPVLRQYSSLMPPEKMARYESTYQSLKTKNQATGNK